MAFKLFVGGLPFSTTQEELETAFAEFGSVTSAMIITDRETGRSKGFGFVEYETAEEGNAAVNALNGKEFGGRTITVNEARPKTEGGDRRGGGGGGGFRGGNGGGGGSFRNSDQRRNSW
jgi:cold-inducible RNA-binding protein